MCQGACFKACFELKRQLLGLCTWWREAPLPRQGAGELPCPYRWYQHEYYTHAGEAGTRLL